MPTLPAPKLNDWKDVCLFHGSFKLQERRVVVNTLEGAWGNFLENTVTEFTKGEAQDMPPKASPPF